MGDQWPTNLDVWLMPCDARAFDMVYDTDTNAQALPYFGAASSVSFSRVLVNAPNHLEAIVLADGLTNRNAELLPTIPFETPAHIRRSELQDVVNNFDHVSDEVADYNDESANDTLTAIKNEIELYLCNPDMHPRRCDLDTLYHAMKFYEQAIVPLNLHVHMVQFPAETINEHTDAILKSFIPMPIPNSRKSKIAPRGHSAPYFEDINPLAQTNKFFRGNLDEDGYRKRDDDYLMHLCTTRKDQARGKEQCLGSGICNFDSSKAARCSAKSSSLEDFAPIAAEEGSILFKLMDADEINTYAVKSLEEHSENPMLRAYFAQPESGVAHNKVFLVYFACGKRVVVNSADWTKTISANDPGIYGSGVWNVFDGTAQIGKCRVTITR